MMLREQMMQVRDAPDFETQNIHQKTKVEVSVASWKGLVPPPPLPQEKKS